MYTSNNLLWTKNVKRQGGTQWAYLDKKVGDVFYLNWPTKFKKNVLAANVGDIILIFQSVNKITGFRKGTYLTHLVTPIDNIRHEITGSTHPHTRLVGVVAHTEIPILKPDFLSFYKPNRGACCRLDLIENKIKPDISLREKQEILWNLFINKDVNLQDAFEVIQTTINEEDETFLEGKERAELRMHKFYERNPDAIKKAKAKARRENRFYCEVCSFNFEFHYPSLGNDFIECHHRNPIATGGVRQTTISDLALVCSNCHRMLHRKNKLGNYLTIEELKQLINK